MNLPSGWVHAPLGALLHRIEAGKNLRCEERPPRQGELGVVKVSAVTWGCFDPSQSKTLPTNYTPPEEAQIHKGDLLISRANTLELVGAVVLVDAEPDGLFLSDKILRLVVDDDLKKCLLSFLRSQQGRTQIEALATGNQFSMRNISQDALRSIELPIPPLAEQRRIVAKLDALFARLARARMEVEDATRLAGKIRLSVLSKLLARFPEASFVRLDEVCRIGTGSTPKRGDWRYYGGGTIPWVTSGVVNQRTVNEPTELITDAALKETNCKIFPAGSLVIALYGEGKTRGKVARLAIAAATNQALAALYDFNEIIDPEWIALFLEARYQETREEAAGGVQPNLNLGIIKAIRLPVPKLHEQRIAIHKVRNAFARAERLEAEATRARALLDRLEAAVLTKAFKGELVPQDPNDEPASVMLERIRAQRAAAAPASKTKRGRRLSSVAG